MPAAENLFVMSYPSIRNLGNRGARAARSCELRRKIRQKNTDGTVRHRIAAQIYVGVQQIKIFGGVTGSD